MAPPLSELSTATTPITRDGAISLSDARAATHSDPVRQALTCLRSSDRRLRQPSAERTDEVLTLLRAATAHLQRAAARPER